METNFVRVSGSDHRRDTMLQTKRSSPKCGQVRVLHRPTTFGAERADGELLSAAPVGRSPAWNIATVR